MEVTATDTAALTGSSPTSGKRRYGSTGITDEYQHDDAIRILLATIATSAAKIDKAITPILGMFDGHHVRVTVLVKTSKNKATQIRDKIGWRVRNEDGVPYKFVDHPNQMKLNERLDQCGLVRYECRNSSRITKEKALEICYPNTQDIELSKQSGLVWTDEDIEYSRREIERTVRHIETCAPLFGAEHTLYDLDMMSKKIGKGSAPKIQTLVESLTNAGHLASQTPTHRR